MFSYLQELLNLGLGRETAETLSGLGLRARKKASIILGSLGVPLGGNRFAIVHNGVEVFEGTAKEIAAFSKKLKKLGKEAAEKYLDDLLEFKKLEKTVSLIPKIKDFVKWFDEIELSKFEMLWQNKIAKQKIASLIRHPGGLHEWLMCSRANVFKKWGISMDEIKYLRTKIDKVIFKNPPGWHGGPGSTKAHNEILELIDGSNNYSDFKKKLINWADNRLKGGKQDLPQGFFK